MSTIAIILSLLPNWYIATQRSASVIYLKHPNILETLLFTYTDLIWYLKICNDNTCCSIVLTKQIIHTNDLNTYIKTYLIDPILLRLEELTLYKGIASKINKHEKKNYKLIDYILDILPAFNMNLVKKNESTLTLHYQLNHLQLDVSKDIVIKFISLDNGNDLIMTMIQGINTTHQKMANLHLSAAKYQNNILALIKKLHFSLYYQLDSIYPKYVEITNNRFLSLPKYILSSIFQFLDIYDWYQLKCVHSKLHVLTEDEHLYKLACKKRKIPKKNKENSYKETLIFTLQSKKMK